MSISTLTLTHITYTPPEAAEPLFEDVSVTFPRGWTAVLGDNGIGKTTLLRIAMGTLRPDSGSTAPSPATLIIGYCPQNTDERPDNLEDFAADWSPETMRIRRDLDIGDDWPWRYEELSGGEAKRLQIACALATRPDVLMLDEPTNHVDEATNGRIVAALRDFTGIGIVVSHDVGFIDALAERCVFFERDHVRGRNVTAVRTRPGNYRQAAASAEHDRRSSDAALHQARHEAARLEAVTARRRHEAALASTRAHAVGAAMNRKDHDARNLLKLHKSLSTDGSAGAASARIAAQRDAAQRRTASIVTAAKRYDGDIWMDAEASHRTELIHLDAGVIRYGSDSVVAAGAASGMATDAATGMTTDAATGVATGPASDSPVDAAMDTAVDAAMMGLTIPELSVGPHDRIGLIGDNGTGKSTLCRILLSRLRAAQPAIPTLSIAQNTTDANAREAMRELASLSAADRSAVLSAYAQLNADPDRLLAGGSPSPGELRKLLLCLGARRHPHLIMLDEPTNHLDLHSRQALARALAAFPGTVIVVSHDRAFLRDAGISTFWRCEPRAAVIGDDSGGSGSGSGTILRL
ncbi:ATP-binding cassette domain-containing protein [Bifidobacterium simiarum]|uniref:ATP-binding cassette domain-containing protein n=1 Tax=Bifidobacterium simiarum TaxID=2045441 RepID=UPI001F0B2AC2|nr:ATP-binding cassette domain-containing protein [Bifidobacterium simiarum]